MWCGTRRPPGDKTQQGCTACDDRHRAVNPSSDHNSDHFEHFSTLFFHWALTLTCERDHSCAMPSPLPALAFGGDYNPEQSPPAAHVEARDLMRESGVDLVTLGVFSWDSL